MEFCLVHWSITFFLYNSYVILLFDWSSRNVECGRLGAGRVGTGGAVSSVADAARHPDGEGRVIHIWDDNACGSRFDLGEWSSHGNLNDARPVMSLWIKTPYTCTFLSFCVDTPAGARHVRYHLAAGADNAENTWWTRNVYLGAAPLGEWRRVEVNLAADLQRLAGEGYTRVRTLSVWTREAWVDDFRVSAAWTAEHNSLGVGAVGHIACSRGCAPGAGGNGAPGLVDPF